MTYNVFSGTLNLTQPYSIAITLNSTSLYCSKQLSVIYKMPWEYQEWFAVAAEKWLADSEQLQRRRVVASWSPVTPLSLTFNNTRIIH